MCAILVHLRRWGLLVILLAILLSGTTRLSRFWVNAGFVALGQALFSQSRNEIDEKAMQAESMLQWATARSPVDKSTWRALGFALAIQGQENEAIEIWERDPDIAPVLIQHWIRARKEARYVEAARWYGLALRLDSSSESNLYCRAGMIYKYDRDVEGALLAFQRATLLSPENQGAWYELGRMYTWRGEYSLALESWDKGLRGSTEEIGLSNLYYQIGRIKQRFVKPPDLSGAWEAYQQALAFDDYADDFKNRADTYFQRGAILALWEQWDEAIMEYETALRIDSEHYWACLSLASALWQIGETESAKLWGQTAVALEPTKKNAYRVLGGFYQAEGDVTQARAMYIQVLEIDPKDRDARQALEVLGKDQGNGQDK